MTKEIKRTWTVGEKSFPTYAEAQTYLRHYKQRSIRDQLIGITKLGAQLNAGAMADAIMREFSVKPLPKKVQQTEEKT